MTTITIERALLERVRNALESSSPIKLTQASITEHEFVIRILRAALAAPAQPDQEFVCSLGCTTECLARQHGVPSECPSLPRQPEPEPPPFDEIALVRAVLKGYPASMAREDALRALNVIEGRPATAPAWNNVPTCEGLWLCDEGDENPYRFTCHDISMPLNPHLVGEGERWYGPIPEDRQ